MTKTGNERIKRKVRKGLEECKALYVIMDSTSGYAARFKLKIRSWCGEPGYSGNRIKLRGINHISSIKCHQSKL